MNNVSNEQIYALALTVMQQIDQISAKLDDTLVIARDIKAMTRDMHSELAAMRHERAHLIQNIARRELH